MLFYLCRNSLSSTAPCPAKAAPHPRQELLLPKPPLLLRTVQREQPLCWAMAPPWGTRSTRRAQPSPRMSEPAGRMGRLSTRDELWELLGEAQGSCCSPHWQLSVSRGVQGSWGTPPAAQVLQSCQEPAWHSWELGFQWEHMHFWGLALPASTAVWGWKKSCQFHEELGSECRRKDANPSVLSGGPRSS